MIGRNLTYGVWAPMGTRSWLELFVSLTLARCRVSYPIFPMRTPEELDLRLAKRRADLEDVLALPIPRRRASA